MLTLVITKGEGRILWYQLYLSTSSNFFKLVMMTIVFSSDSSYGFSCLLWSKIIDLMTYVISLNVIYPSLWFPGPPRPPLQYGSGLTPSGLWVQSWVFFSTDLGEDIEKAYTSLGLPRWSSGKETACPCRRQGSIPGLARSPGEGNGNPLQDSCLENRMDRGTYSPWGCKELDISKHSTHTWFLEEESKRRTCSSSSQKKNASSEELRGSSEWEKLWSQN